MHPDNDLATAAKPIPTVEANPYVIRQRVAGEVAGDLRDAYGSLSRAKDWSKASVDLDDVFRTALSESLAVVEQLLDTATIAAADIDGS